MERVLVATDGSKFAEGAARRAVSLLANDADYTVVAVVGVSTFVAGPEVGMAASLTSDPAITAVEEEARADAVTTAGLLGERTRVRVEHGDPGPVICQIADDEAFDLIVVGSHGSGLIERVLFGSVSHHVLQHAPCPVLLVRVPNTN